MEVVCIKKILVQNLLIYIGLHCVRRSSWTVTTLATLLTTTLIQISRHFYFGFFSKTNPQMMILLTSIVSRSKSKFYKAQKAQKYALNSQLQALQILTNDDEVEN